MQVGLFCTANLPSGRLAPLCNKTEILLFSKWYENTGWWIFWLPLQWSCLKSILITRISQLVIFLIKIFVKLIVNNPGQLSLKKIISKLRLNSREFMNWTNNRIVCISMPQVEAWSSHFHTVFKILVRILSRSSWQRDLAACSAFVFAELKPILKKGTMCCPALDLNHVGNTLQYTKLWLIIVCVCVCVCALDPRYV